MFEKLRSEFENKVHFIGINGIGMSALALLLNKIGVKVQGSDLKENYITKTLQNADIQYFNQHNEKNIDDKISLIVKTSIIKDDNCEIVKAIEKNIKIITRAELLAKIMLYKKSITVAGTHGKTSTTAMISTILEQANLDPIVINGGIINQFQSNFKLGDGDFLVAESDESDGSFVNLPTFIGAITNIEPEHLEFYNNDFAKVKKYYEKYVEQIEENGLCVMCIDDENVAEIYNKFKNIKKNLISYSVKKDADIIAKNINLNNSGAKFDAIFKGEKISDINFSAFGIHNVSNSLIAIAIAKFLKIDDEIIKKALKNYQGVKRRFTKVGEFQGITIIDDYAHHPTEISATLKAARQFIGDKKIILVLQPHKYSRVRDLFQEFATCVQEADIVILTEIYSANQAKIDGISKETLAQKMQELGHKKIIKLENDEDLAKLIKENAAKNDIVICAGAGTITQMANNLENQLKNLLK